jgi:hypothetical protein
MGADIFEHDYEEIRPSLGLTDFTEHPGIVPAIGQRWG